MSNTILHSLLSPLGHYSRLFHKRTEIKKFNNTSLSSVTKSTLERWGKILYKAYPRFRQIVLPVPILQKYNLYAVLFQRESSRDFIKSPLSLTQLSNILYFSSGEKKVFTHGDSTKRFYPSAGARYPLEAYAIVLNVERIDSAIYHYHIKTHSLELILEKPFTRRVFMQFHQDWIKKSSVLVVFTAIFNRTEEKYGDRGYRHILTEYGHAAQNMYLVSTALGVGCCSIGGFIDEGLNAILDVDGINESVVGVVALGVKGG